MSVRHLERHYDGLKPPHNRQDATDHRKSDVGEEGHPSSLLCNVSVTRALMLLGHELMLTWDSQSMDRVELSDHSF